MPDPLTIARSGQTDLVLLPALANRHGLITEATGTGKTVSLVRLIRSKGVGVYFVTQNPLDVPDKVLGQLGNRIQHALRAFTPRDLKAAKTAAETLRANPGLDAEKVITELGLGEALVSFLDEKGSPTIVERAFILPPASRIGPITAEERKAIIASSAVAGVYEAAVDRESAYEKLKGRIEASAASARQAPATAGTGTTIKDALGGLITGTGRKDGIVEAMAKSAAHHGIDGGQADRSRRAGIDFWRQAIVAMGWPFRIVGFFAPLRRNAALTIALVVCACAQSNPETTPIPLTPREDRGTAPVVRREVPAAQVAHSTPGSSEVTAPSLIVKVPADALYVCVSQLNGQQQQVAIAFESKVGELCRKHPEMGPCQYERETCRRSGGRVFAGDGKEITLAMEAEYDKRVMRVRFKAN